MGKIQKTFMAVTSSFDANSWYHISSPSKESDWALDVVWGKFSSSGSVFGAPVNGQDEAGQKWQIIESPIDSSAFVLREQYTGPGGFLNVENNQTCAYQGDNCHLLICDMGQLPDETSTWYILPWGDGTYYMFNKANGSNYHMDIQENGSYLWMNPNVTGKSGSRQWNFEALEPINNSSFSTVSDADRISK